MTDTNNAFVGNFFLARGDGGSPELFTRVCQNFGISGLGQKNDQVESTTFCSGGIKEYIAGLADGSEVTFEMNFETIKPSAQVLYDMIQDVKLKKKVNYQVQVEGSGVVGVVDCLFEFTATALSWTANPSPSAKNTISYGSKITGDIEITLP